ncbi:MFS transporter [Acuticoccus kandeliae]|uniref:MFS transporter n=1 Tax=Acuticoccus kandeliae TaxID=2073160 RepID=UPI00196AB384|nr:MFS transporter [Acuticoccus kandeliae]
MDAQITPRDLPAEPKPADDAVSAAPSEPTPSEAKAETPAPQGEAAPAQPPFVPMPRVRAAGYILASLVLALSQGFGQSIISANLQQLQGGFSATQAETTWLAAAYLAPNVSLTLALIKIRAQYGLRNFAELSILGFLLAAFLNYAANDINSAIAVRFMSGMAAAPMTSLAFLYMLEPFPPQKKMSVGLSLALTFIFIGPSFTSVVSPPLLDIGLWHGLTALEVALAMVGFGLIYCLPLAPVPRAKVIKAADIISYLLIAIGMGAAAVALTLGPLYWWREAAWIGWLLATAIVTITAAAIIELNREHPLLDIRWLASPAVLHFTAALLLFRLVLSEQSSGAAGLFRALGLLNDQTQTLFLVIMAATIAGGLICAALMKPGREKAFHVVALILLIIGASMDANATSATRPVNMYLSQTLIALASALFLPPAMLSGLMSALARGREYLLSFVIVFLTTQKLGGILGSAVFSTFITLRRAFHAERISEALSVTNPFVNERIAQLAAANRALSPDQMLTSAQGLSILNSQVTTEATVLAYNDAFLAIAFVSSLALAALLGHIIIDAVKSRRARLDADATPAGAATPQPA